MPPDPSWRWTGAQCTFFNRIQITDQQRSSHTDLRVPSILKRDHARFLPPAWSAESFRNRRAPSWRRGSDFLYRSDHNPRRSRPLVVATSTDRSTLRTGIKKQFLPRQSLFSIRQPTSKSAPLHSETFLASCENRGEDFFISVETSLWQFSRWSWFSRLKPVSWGRESSVSADFCLGTDLSPFPTPDHPEQKRGRDFFVSTEFISVSGSPPILPGEAIQRWSFLCPCRDFSATEIAPSHLLKTAHLICDPRRARFTRVSHQCANLYNRERLYSYTLAWLLCTENPNTYTTS